MLFMPGPQKSPEVVRQFQEMAMEAPLEERVLGKQDIKLNLGTVQGKTIYDLLNENDLGACSPSTIAREEMVRGVGGQVDLINNKMDMLTVQEKFVNGEVSPKIARLMSNFEEPIQNCSSEVVDMEVDRLPVQEVGPMVNKTVLAVPRMRKVSVPKKRKGENYTMKVIRIDDMFGQQLQMPGVGLNKGDNLKRKKECYMEDGPRMAKRRKGE